MDCWILMHNSQMANNLVKWWKTKFLNGYKQFSVVECGDGGRVSDTEELLGRLGSEDDANERLRAACTTPPLPSQDETTPTPTLVDDATAKVQSGQDHLSFEEFSCDVSVENGDNKPGQERQEFSFTLYDFDGHGKITKDDIAGLVTTIYEALGSSVKVPHYGSKTIKVKLTVSPDQRKHVSATIINQKPASQPSDNDSTNKQQNQRQPITNIRYKRDLNVTIRQGGSGGGASKEKRRHCGKKTKAKPKAHQCCHHRHFSGAKVERVEEENDENNPFVSDDSDRSSRVSSCDEDEEFSTNKRVKRKKKGNPRYTIPNLFMKDLNLCNESKKTLKKRSGSLQRQELLEIIQANMEKNNLSFQTTRKHSNHLNTEPTKAFDVSKQKKVNPLQYLANIVDPTHFYVDLASLQNTTQLTQTNCQYDKLIDAVMCVSNKKLTLNNNNKQPKCRKHRIKHKNNNNNHLTDLSDLPLRYHQFLKYPIINDENTVGNLGRKAERPEGVHIVTGHTSSPHHLRHRNRQEDQARAMAQVVHWLEQEFSNNLNTKQERAKNQENHKKGAPQSPGVERHEHHHVHEHIHHHYHHYQDTPLVV